MLIAHEIGHNFGLRHPFDDKSKYSGKVILLMHDRQFRKGKLNKDGEVDIFDRTELNKLGELIDYFKSINADFKTLDEY